MRTEIYNKGILHHKFTTEDIYTTNLQQSKIVLSDDEKESDKRELNWALGKIDRFAYWVSLAAVYQHVYCNCC